MTLRGDKYETVDEIETRLSNSVVLYDGKPVLITGIRFPEAEDGKEIARVFFKELPIGGGVKDVRKFLSSKKFDLSPFPMGYFNHDGRVGYITRTANRQYKQGLNAKNCKIFDKTLKTNNKHVMFDRLSVSKAFADMVNNIYPSFQEAEDMLDRADRTEVAIAHNFALVFEEDIDCYTLLRRGDVCGLLLPGSKKVKLSRKFDFLKEEIEEAKIPLV